MAVRFVNPFIQWVNGSSVVESGAKLYFYDTGTSTPKTTFSDSALSVANANPVVADANGKFGDIYLSTAQYKVVLKTSADVTIWTADPVGDSLEDVAVTGTFALSGDISPAQITANQNNYNPTGLSGASVVRINSDAARDITGLAGGADGRKLSIYNVGSFSITLKDESASSTAANRFALQADIVIAPDTGVDLWYDSTSARYRAQGGTSLDSLTSNGADIASASTINLTTATGDTVDVTGTTPITAITLADGDQRRVRFTGILTLTHGASLVLPGSVNITTAAGDYAVFRGYAAGVVRCVQYQKASGVATVVSIAGTLTAGTTVMRDPYTAGSVVTQAHGLGAIPTLLVIYLECLTGDLGYTAGDRVEGSWVDNNGTGNGFSVSRDATNIVISTTTALYLQHKSSTTTTQITAANWRVVVIPYKLN